MKIQADDLVQYHCPRWNELPEIELYIDQVVTIIQSNLKIFVKDEENIITPSMINNYVKQQIIEAPEKKKYKRTHLAHLFVICIFKRLMSISDIADAITQIKKVYSVEEAYNLFCDELENALKATINGELITYAQAKNREIARLRAIAIAYSNSVLADRLMLLRKN